MASDSAGRTPRTRATKNETPSQTTDVFQNAGMPNMNALALAFHELSKSYSKVASVLAPKSTGDNTNSATLEASGFLASLMSSTKTAARKNVKETKNLKRPGTTRNTNLRSKRTRKEEGETLTSTSESDE